MVIDTSAIVAILRDEAERPLFVELIEAADVCRMSTANFLETSIVIQSRFGEAGLHDLDQFIAVASIELHPVDAEQARAARRAYSRFGKGRHRAGLNFGDCFSYALAHILDEPLLAKGDDFLHTDARLAGAGDIHESPRANYRGETPA